MKTNRISSFRAAALAAALFLAPALALANDTDHAAQILALSGRVPVNSAGPYVERGTFLVQVAAKLGQPSVKLADGTWLYQNYDVEGSAAKGTLVVRFNRGCVSELSLVTPAVAMAMTAPQKADDKTLVANRN